MKTTKRLTIISFLAILLSCTPQVKTAVNDGMKCIAANIDKTPEQIAVICGVDVTPDLVSIVTTEQAMKKGNCPTPKGPGL